MREIPLYHPEGMLPPGYRIEWWEQDEHYHWVAGERYSCIYSTLRQVRRAAWDDSRQSWSAPQWGPGQEALTPPAAPTDHVEP